MNLDRAMITFGGLMEGLIEDYTGTTVSTHAGLLDSLDGFVVGGAGVHELIVPARGTSFFDPEGYGDLARWVRNLPDEVRYVGAWLNGDQYHFDAVDLYQNLDVALKVAAERDEIAIWDAFRQQEVSVSDPR